MPDEMLAEEPVQTFCCSYCGRTRQEVPTLTETRPNMYHNGTRWEMREVEHLFCSRCVYSCEDCHVVYPRDRGSRQYCEQCLEHYIECYNCGEYYHRERDNYETDANHNTICESCLESDYVFCERCAHYERNDNRCEPDRPEWLMGYGWHPKLLKFLGKRSPENLMSPDLFLGWELETEAQSPESMLAPPDFAWACEDGSLGENGVEYVSHPMTYAWIKEHKTEITAFLKQLQAQGIRSYNTETCGMHVHLSRDSFTSLHLYKFMRLMYENPMFTLAISQRKRELLAQWASVENCNRDQLIRKAREKFQNSRDEGRYAAVNLLNEQTIECRIFRGTTKEESFYKNLEFCVAVFEFTKDCRMLDVTPAKFATFVEANKKEYPNLASFLTQQEVKAACV